MKAAFFNFFREYDLFSAPAGLRIKSNQTLKSCCLGFLSILIFAGLIYILVTKWISVMNYQQINFQLSETIISGDQAEGEIGMVSLAFGSLAYWRFEFYYDFHWNYYQDGQLKQRSRMVRCQPEQWTTLGQNYNKTFYDTFMNSNYCPNITAQTKYKLKKAFSQQKPSYVTITLDVCDKNQRDGCYDQYGGLYLNYREFFKVWVYFLDTGISPTNINSTFNFLNYNIFIITDQIKQYVQMEFTTVKIQTDNSIWPIQSKQTIKSSVYDSIISNPAFYDWKIVKTKDVIFQIVFTMNRKIKIYSRGIGKVDQIVSYVGGLLSIVMPVLVWFFISFNKYRFQIMVAQGAFNYSEDGQKIKESDFYFWTYIKYTIYTWINTIFRCRLKWKNCNEIDDVREEINQQMDVRNMFLRLQATERVMNYKIQDNEQTCINLIEPLSLVNSRKERLELDYYDQVIKGNSAATLSDLLKEHQTQNLKKHQSNNTMFPIDSAQTIMPSYMKQDSEQQPNKDFSFGTKSPLTFKAYKYIQNNPTFSQTKLQSQQIQLSLQFIEAENRMTNYYQNLKPQDRQKFESLIPILILHRFNTKIQKRKERQLDQRIKQRQKIVYEHERNQDDSVKIT